MRTALVRLTKFLFFKSPFWRTFLPVMKFDMSIPQINFIINSIEEIKADGAVLEIGVGGGATSIMINLAMCRHNKKREFNAIDTFDGFMKDDIKFEQDHRGKLDTYSYYRSNSKEWYTKTLLAYGIKDSKIFQCDAKKFNYSTVAPIAFCLFDVDLYQPTKEVLPNLYTNLVPGGMIVVDDCSPELSIYDGAGQAYREFCKQKGFKEEIVFEKLGIIRKPL